MCCDFGESDKKPPSQVTGFPTALVQAVGTPFFITLRGLIIPLGMVRPRFFGESHHGYS